VPDVRNLSGARAVLEIDEDRGYPRTRETAQEVKLWRFLQRTLEPFGNLFEHVVDTGARPCGLHHHRLDHKRWVFVASESHESEKTCNHSHNHKIARERPFIDRHSGEIEANIAPPPRPPALSGGGGGLARPG